MSVVALGLVGTELSDALLDAVVITGLLVVLGMLLVKPGRWLEGKEGRLRPFGLSQAVVYNAI